MTGLVKVLLVVDDEPRNVVSFAKTLSGSLRTIRIRGRQPRAEPETGRPASSHRRPCTEPSDSRWMSERQAGDGGPITVTLVQQYGRPRTLNYAAWRM